MNAEELTILMDTLRELGGDGKTAFIWWLVFDKLLPVIGWITAVAILVFGLARPMFVLVTAESFMRNLRDRLNIGSPGHLTASEMKDVQRRIDKLLGDNQ